MNLLANRIDRLLKEFGTTADVSTPTFGGGRQKEIEFFWSKATPTRRESYKAMIKDDPEATRIVKAIESRYLVKAINIFLAKARKYERHLQ